MSSSATVSHETTFAEREHHVRRLVERYHDNPGLQEVVELGAERVLELHAADPGDVEGRYTEHGLRLAERIHGAATANLPEFSNGSWVRIRNDGRRAQVLSRFLTDGGWEYNLSIGRHHAPMPENFLEAE